MNDNKDLLVEAREYESFDEKSNPDGELIHRLANALEAQEELLAVALAANAALAESLEAATVERAVVEAQALERVANEILKATETNGLGVKSSKLIDPNGKCSVWLFIQAYKIREGSK